MNSPLDGAAGIEIFMYLMEADIYLELLLQPPQPPLFFFFLMFSFY